MAVSRKDVLKTHTSLVDDPTGTVGAIQQAGSHSNALEFNLQAGKTMLEKDVRTSFVPVGRRYKMEKDLHHIKGNQQIRLRVEKREARENGEQRVVLKDLYDRTHHNDGTLVTKQPTVVELLSRFPAESRDEMIMKDENIGRMPKNMQILSHIRKVDLSKNSIKTLSDGIADIVGLQELILGHNQLVELPNTTKRLTNLKILDVRSNSLTELPDMWGMKKLQNLNVADNELEYINDSVQSLSSLTVLDVRYNQLRDYTHALCDLVDNLCTVYFDYNFVTHFPKPIGRCNGLRSLNMSKNEMTTLPIGCIEYMTGLTKLDLSQNWLTDIPSTIGINQGLRELILNNNRIVVAPRSLMALTGLVTLNLACNHVKRVPEITTLTSLTELRLENNCLERIPVRLYYLTKLKVLETRGNDNLHTPPASIACQGKRSIFQWLAEEDVREQKAGLFDQRLQRIMQHIVKTFQSKEALQRAFDAADADGSGSMTLIELDDWIKSLGINNLSFQDIQFLGSAMDSDGSGFVEADELIKVYERFKYQKVVAQEEAEEVDEEYLKRARAALVDEEMNQAAEQAALEAAEARRKFEERRKAKEAAKVAAATGK